MIFDNELIGNNDGKYTLMFYWEIKMVSNTFIGRRFCIVSFICCTFFIGSAWQGECVYATKTNKSNIYVAVNGNDNSGDGSQERSFATIARAKQKLRILIPQGLTSDVHIYIRQGTYRLDETLVFDIRDSATADHNIIYQAYTGESPVISGGYEIAGDPHSS